MLVKKLVDLLDRAGPQLPISCWMISTKVNACLPNQERGTVVQGILVPSRTAAASNHPLPDESNYNAGEHLHLFRNARHGVSKERKIGRQQEIRGGGRKKLQKSVRRYRGDPRTRLGKKGK